MSFVRRIAEAGPARVRQAAEYRFERSDQLLDQLDSLKSDFEARCHEVDQRMDSLARLVVDDAEKGSSDLILEAAGLSTDYETFVEEPFIFAAIADLAPGSRILDLGGGARWRVGSLAASGHYVTAVGPTPSGGSKVRHPKLTYWSESLPELRPSAPYDVVVLASGVTPSELTPDSDLVAILDQVMAESGRLVLTASYRLRIEGDPWFDRPRLLDLLQGWAIRYVSVARRLDPGVWDLQATNLVDATEQEQIVMLVAARLDGGPDV